MSLLPAGLEHFCSNDVLEEIKGPFLTPVHPICGIDGHLQGSWSQKLSLCQSESARGGLHNYVKHCKQKHARQQTLNFVLAGERSCSKALSCSKTFIFLPNSFFQPSYVTDRVHHFSSASAPLFVEGNPALFLRCLEDVLNVF